jgi:hypothetical protein
MEQADLLYSGLMVTALMLSVWAAALVTATCIFFAPTWFAPRAGQPPIRKP